ncbi:Uncharacterised protein [Mycobacteroides abscessus subsp. abscessus]|nr:Uncharacterised protein [Mycobacteroides abscessus subsp. abscessus]
MDKTEKISEILKMNDKIKKRTDGYKTQKLVDVSIDKIKKIKNK